MRCRFVLLIPGLVLVVLLAVCAGCIDDWSNHAISVGLDLRKPIRLGQPVTVTITLDFTADVKAVSIGLSGDGPHMPVGTIAFWPERDASKGQRWVVSTPITFTAPGEYHLIAGVRSYAGTYQGKDIRVYVDQNGAVINPTPWPAGVPAPVERIQTSRPAAPTLTPKPGIIVTARP